MKCLRPFAVQACIITVRDKADVLRVRLVCIYKLVFFCDITDLVLVHLANGEESVSKLFLRHAVKHITLIL